MTQIILPKRVQEFRNFVRQHPHLFETLKKENHSWQELYDLWDEDGEGASLFQRNVDKKEASEQTNNREKKINWHDLLNKLSEMDVDRVEKHVKQLSSTLEQIQHISNQTRRRSSGTQPRKDLFF